MSVQPSQLGHVAIDIQEELENPQYKIEVAHQVISQLASFIENNSADFSDREKQTIKVLNENPSLDGINFLVRLVNRSDKIIVDRNFKGISEVSGSNPKQIKISEVAFNALKCYPGQSESSSLQRHPNLSHQMRRRPVNLERRGNDNTICECCNLDHNPVLKISGLVCCAIALAIIAEIWGPKDDD